MKIKLDKKRKYLLACSYGPDSMCLFDVLLKNNYNFSVANVNYNLRKESTQEQNDLVKFCEQNNVEIFTLNVYEKIERNIEEKCREIRYDFFASIYFQNSFDGLLVAHNEDDLLETYLLQKRRGGFVEYYGLQDVTEIKGMVVYRPLLNYSKSELLNYDVKNKVPYSIDSSNNEDKYLRNQIRHSKVQNMPKTERMLLLKQILEENCEKLTEINSILRIYTNEISDIKKMSIEDLQIFMTYNARVYVDGIEFSKSRIEEIKKILESNKPNIIHRLYKDFYFVKSYEKFYFKFLNNDVSYFYVLEEPGELDTPYFYLDFSKSSKGRNVTKSDYPIFIRNASKDDEILIKDYWVKMRRAFIDWKMPAELRLRWPVIEDKNHNILYIPRYSDKFVIPPDCNFYVKL